MYRGDQASEVAFCVSSCEVVNVTGRGRLFLSLDLRIQLFNVICDQLLKQTVARELLI